MYHLKLYLKIFFGNLLSYYLIDIADLLSQQPWEQQVIGTFAPLTPYKIYNN